MLAGCVPFQGASEVDIILSHLQDEVPLLREACPDVGIYYRNQPTKEHRQRRVAVDNDFLQAAGFADAIDNGGTTILDAGASLAIFATCEAALESCRTGQCAEVKRSAPEA